MVVKVYRVHPAIGIARVGDSDDYFLGPETLADLHENPKEYAKPPIAGRVYRDNTAAPGKILRQAVRFRVYEFEYASAKSTSPSRVTEVTADKFEIAWEVEVANKKSFPVGATRSDTNREFALSVQVLIPVGETRVHTVGRTIAGPTAVSVAFLKLIPDNGRLVLVPGLGSRGHVHANEAAARSALGPTSAGWWDDLGDGPVKASVRPKGSTRAFDVAVPAWVVLAQPAFTGPTRHVITLYDRLFSLYWSKKGFTNVSRGGSLAKAYSFVNDVLPVLHRTSLASWVSNNAMVFHGPGRVADYTDPTRLQLLGRTSGTAAKEERKKILARLREPGVIHPPGGPMRMPPGALPNLTEFQFRAFKAWVDESKDFALDWPGTSRPPTPLELPGEQTKAQLASASGGSFAPGIELGGVVLDPSTWFEFPAAPLDFPSWDDAFRVNMAKIQAGDLTRNLTVPWQVDMLTMCIGQLNAPALPHGIEPNWPGARPLEIVSALDDQMHRWGMRADGGIDATDAIDKWMKLGFLRKVVSSSGAVRYLDAERDISYP